jgi:hypothetical protein
LWAVRPAPMSTSPTSPPSLDSVLTSLRHHLLPSPLLSSLPSALTLFAHLQLLSRVVRSQATEALRVHDDLVTRLAEEGVSAEDMLRRGILTRVERRRLKRWARRDEGDEMFGFSLEMRKHVSDVQAHTEQHPPPSPSSLRQCSLSCVADHERSTSPSSARRRTSPSPR